MISSLRRLARWSCLPIFALIAYLSLVPGDPQSEGGFIRYLSPLAEIILGDPDAADKIGHAIAYCVLTAAAVFGFEHRRGIAPPVLIAFACGGIFEALQSFVPDRSPSLADLVANGSGVGLGLICAILLVSFERATR